jgi:RuvB-like protein 1 (pontin 52)
MLPKKGLDNLILKGQDKFWIGNILKLGVENKNFQGIPVLIFCEFEFQKELFISTLKDSLVKNFPFSRLSIDFNLKKESEQLVEILQTQKKAVGIRISEFIEFYEGEVIDLILNSKIQKDQAKNFHSILGLKTTEGKLRLKISGNILDELIIKKVKKGDVIRIIPDIYLIQNFGKSVNSPDNYQLNSKKIFSIPKGKVFKKKVLIKEMTLHDFEIENFKNINDSRFIHVKNFKRLNNDTEILLKNYIQLGKANIFKGVMIIKESYDLTPFCFQVLSDLPNDWSVPAIFILTNKISPVSIPQFKLDSFKVNGLDNFLSISIKKFTGCGILKLMSDSFLKKQKILTGSGFQIIKKILKKSNLNFCLSVVSLSNIAIYGKELYWICENTIKFFNSVILNLRELMVLGSSKNNLIKVHRSF